jgi:(2R)-sulfolactate sulfo-lyase subunit beta
VDVSGILCREMNLNAAGDKLLAEMTRVYNGRNTVAEALEPREFVITKLYRSA